MKDKTKTKCLTRYVSMYSFLHKLFPKYIQASEAQAAGYQNGLKQWLWLICIVSVVAARAKHCPYEMK